VQGIEVPLPLRKYIPGAPEFLPYTKELPKNSTSNKAPPKSKTDSAPSGGPKLNPPSTSNVADKMADMKV
jgi:seryl-tRNA synthetase